MKATKRDTGGKDHDPRKLGRAGKMVEAKARLQGAC